MGELQRFLSIEESVILLKIKSFLTPMFVMGLSAKTFDIPPSMDDGENMISPFIISESVNAITHSKYYVYVEHAHYDMYLYVQCGAGFTTICCVIMCI